MLNVFINTWGNYNENGADGGEWITLPMETGDLKETLNRIAENMGDFDPEFCIHDYEWTSEMELREVSEMESITELNAELQRLDELREWEQEIYCAALEIWGHSEVDPDNLDEYNLYKDITSDYDLGYYWAVESGCYDLKSMGHLANYIDFESYGRDIRFESDGGFTSLGWIERC